MTKTTEILEPLITEFANSAVCCEFVDESEKKRWQILIEYI